MHELSIAQALMEQLEAIALKEHGKITVASVNVGSLSGVDPDALDTAFKIAAEGTQLASAVLRITSIPAKIICRSCHMESHPETPLFECPHCGSLDCEITAGRDMLLKSVELET